eukprot:1350377-Lingulodinium_polyedra.AAC.1
MSSLIGESGQATVRGFESWFSTAQRDQVVVLKQGRLLREEKVNQAKAAGGGKGSPKGGKGKGGGAEGAADAQ